MAQELDSAGEHQQAKRPSGSHPHTAANDRYREGNTNFCKTAPAALPTTNWHNWFFGLNDRNGEFGSANGHYGAATPNSSLWSIAGAGGIEISAALLTKARCLEW